MIAVGILAALRSIQAFQRREIEFRTAGIVALAGLAGAPGGVWAGRLLPEKWLLSLFAAIVVVVALRLMSRNREGRTATLGKRQGSFLSATAPTFALTGFTTGFLAGLLGIGGGFIITPALVLFCRLEIHRAMATSMFSIALISVAAMTGHWFAGQRPPMATVGLFTLGGLLGLFPGSLVAARCSERRLRRTFALILLLLAVFIVIREHSK